MQAAIDRVMQSYGMMVNLTPAQEAEAREKVTNILKDKGGDEHDLAVEGLKYLLGHVPKPRRRTAHLSTASSSCCGS
jgi:ribosomal protein S6